MADSTKEADLEQIRKICIDALSQEKNDSIAQILSIVNEKLSDNLIPCSIFTKELGLMESIVKYLKENLQLSYHEIGTRLNRDERTIWNSYDKAKKKQEAALVVDLDNPAIPIGIFERRDAVMPTIVKYLVKNYRMSYRDIALLLKRDQRNIWVAYNKR